MKYRTIKVLASISVLAALAIAGCTAAQLSKANSLAGGTQPPAPTTGPAIDNLGTTIVGDVSPFTNFLPVPYNYALAGVLAIAGGYFAIKHKSLSNLVAAAAPEIQDVLSKVSPAAGAVGAVALPATLALLSHPAAQSGLKTTG